MVLFGIELGASSHPASGPAAERPYVRRSAMNSTERGDSLASWLPESPMSRRTHSVNSSDTYRRWLTASGKTILARELLPLLEATGRNVVRASSIDGFTILLRFGIALWRTESRDEATSTIPLTTMP